MAFFLSGVSYNDVMVTGWREGTSKQGNKYVSLSVCDKDGNSNNVSSSDDDTIRFIRGLKQGDRVNLKLVVAGGPKRQYVMIAHGIDGIYKCEDVAGY